MARFGLCGPSYLSQSPNVAADWLMNWYTETLEIQDGKGQVALYPTPGSRLFSTIDAGPVLKLWVSLMSGRLFALTAYGFYELDSGGNVTVRFKWPSPPVPEAFICEGHQQL